MEKRFSPLTKEILILFMLNDMTHTTVATPITSLDLTFVSSLLYNYTQKWDILTDLLGSNHYSMTIQFDTSPL